eukprot:5121631-Prymnesium_polylepis.2
MHHHHLHAHGHAPMVMTMPVAVAVAMPVSMHMDASLLAVHARALARSYVNMIHAAREIIVELPERNGIVESRQV